MFSNRYKQLCDRVAEMREHLLPTKFSDTDEYDDYDRVAMLALSFRILAHAEIEAYFEDRVIEIAKSALNAWDTVRHLCHPIMCLLAFSGREMRKPPESLTAPSDNKLKEWPSLLDPTERLRICVTDFIRAVKNENHGIRERNLLLMLLPIGVDYCDFDPVVIADFNSFGVKRGEAAHTSSTAPHLRKGMNPKDEFMLVLRLLEGIKPIDMKLNNLLESSCIAKG